PVTYLLSLHDALPIYLRRLNGNPRRLNGNACPLNGNSCPQNMYAYGLIARNSEGQWFRRATFGGGPGTCPRTPHRCPARHRSAPDRKSTRLNSSHSQI